MRMSSADRLWKKLAWDRSCLVNSVCPEAMRSSAPTVTGAMRSTVLWKRSVAVSVGPTSTASCRTMSPASSSSFIMCAVTPTSVSPLIRAQIKGEKPAYFGSSESCTFSVPWRG